MGQYHYPSPYWDDVGDLALDLIDGMLTVNVDKRATAEECLARPWMCKESAVSPDGATDASMALSPDIWTMQLTPKLVLDSEGSAMTAGLQAPFEARRCLISDVYRKYEFFLRTM
ncbi:hypothetical protein IFM47457_09542 [Aspergillus lentulus]|nr:hypothetical protein IFM47457_09542 [Aspergillus lentulus]